MFKVRCPALGHLSGRGRLEFQALQAEERPVIASRRICGGLPLQGLGKFGEQLEFDRLSGNAEHLHAAGLRSLTLPSACYSYSCASCQLGSEPFFADPAYPYLLTDYATVLSVTDVLGFRRRYTATNGPKLGGTTLWRYWCTR